MCEVQKRDNSMVSTKMSKNLSMGGGGFFDAESRREACLVYANQPMKKQLARWLQSSSTWRHSSHRYSFSKDSRFKTTKLNCTQIIEPQLPSTNTRKSCTFGKGQRRPISQLVLRNAREKPSPNAYDLTAFNESPRNQRYGKTFGIGWNQYEHVHIPHRNDVYSGHLTKDNPPAHYEVRETPGKHKRAFSLYGRLKMYSQKQADITKGNPGPHHKIKDRHLQNEVGMHERNFSFGERIDFSAPANDNPGAIYDLPGLCDKFTNIKKKCVPKI